MRINARIEFLGSKAQKAARAMYDTLRNSKMYEGVDINDDYDDTVALRFRKKEGGLPLIAQYQFLALNLSEVGSPHSGYAFVGPKCPNISHGVDHATDRRNLYHFPDPQLGEVWRCREPRCRYKQPLGSDDFMSVSDFRMNFSLLIAEKVSHLPPGLETASFKELADQQKETITGKTTYTKMPTREEKQKVCKTLLEADYSKLETDTLMRYLGLPEKPNFKYANEFGSSAVGAAFLDGKFGSVLLVGSDTEMVGRRMISNWIASNKHDDRYVLAVAKIPRVDRRLYADTETYTSKPGTLTFQEGMEEIRFVGKATVDTGKFLEQAKKMDEEQATKLVDSFFKAYPAIKEYFRGQQNTVLQVENAKLKNDIDTADTAIEFLRNQLKEKNQDKPAPKDVVSAADDMLRWLAGINFQDHSIKDQREFNSKFSALKNALLEEKYKG